MDKSKTRKRQSVVHGLLHSKRFVFLREDEDGLMFRDGVELSKADFDRLCEDNTKTIILVKQTYENV